MKGGATFTIGVLLLAASALAADVTDAPSVAEARRLAQRGATVRFTGTVVCDADDRILIEDDSAGVLSSRGGDGYRIGDIVRVTATGSAADDSCTMQAQRVERVRSPPSRWQPRSIGPGDMRRTDELSYRQVLIVGRVVEAFRDELDAEWTFLILEEDGFRAPIAVRGGSMPHNPARLVESEVAVTGIFMPNSGGGRSHMGPHVVDYDGTGVQIVTPPPDDPFASAEPISFDARSVARASRGGRRVRASGTVVATWSGNAFFLRTDDDRRLRVFLAKRVSLPEPGARVTAVGFVRSNVFFARLTGANWMAEPETAARTADPVADIDARELLVDAANRRKLRPDLDGRLVRLVGRVTDATRIGSECRMTLDSDRVPVVVRAPGMEMPEVGSDVEVTGACLLTEDAAAGDADFVRLDGCVILPRNADDVRTIRSPSWWTPVRLAVAVGVLFLLMVAAIVWSVFLQRLVERRTAQLLKERLAHREADLRVDERMRLAVELHDSIAQDLTGVGLQLEAADRAYAAGSPKTGPILAAARRTLDACTKELRGCLWDLRNDSFGDTDVSAAVRKAIDPHLGEAAAEVEMSVPRECLDDSAFHAVLSILRELTVNAVRHGGARLVKVRGAAEGGVLRVTVSDDGCGFDPETRPGDAEGHFGLRGISERLERFGGTLEISSAPGRGAAFTFSMEVG